MVSLVVQPHRASSQPPCKYRILHHTVYTPVRRRHRRHRRQAETSGDKRRHRRRGDTGDTGDKRRQAETSGAGETVRQTGTGAGRSPRRRLTLSRPFPPCHFACPSEQKRRRLVTAPSRHPLPRPPSPVPRVPRPPPRAARPACRTRVGADLI